VSIAQSKRSMMMLQIPSESLTEEKHRRTSTFRAYYRDAIPGEPKQFEVDGQQFNKRESRHGITRYAGVGQDPVMFIYVRTATAVLSEE
jgi:hypothetical protein